MFLRKANGVNEYQNSGEYYEINGDNFTYYYNDDASYVIGAGSEEYSIDEEVEAFFEHNLAEYVERILEVCEEENVTTTVKSIVLTSNRYDFKIEIEL